MQTQQMWFVRSERTVTGPYGLRDLQELVDQGRLMPGTDVSLDGEIWIAAVGIPKLEFRPGVVASAVWSAHLARSSGNSAVGEGLSWDEIRTLARWQYFGNLALLALIVVYWGLILSGGLPMVLAVLLWFGLAFIGTTVQFGFVTAIVQILRFRHAWLWGLAAPLPVMGPITFYAASRAATKRLQAQNLRVGMFGATPPSMPPAGWEYQGPRVTVPRRDLDLRVHLLLSAGVGGCATLFFGLCLVLALADAEPTPVDPASAPSSVPAGN